MRTGSSGIPTSFSGSRNSREFQCTDRVEWAAGRSGGLDNGPGNSPSSSASNSTGCRRCISFPLAPPGLPNVPWPTTSGFPDDPWCFGAAPVI